MPRGGSGGSAIRTGALVLGFAFLYAPIVLLVLYSFNASRLVTVWAGFSTRWYGELLKDEAFRAAALTSLEVAAMAATLSLVLGTLPGSACRGLPGFPGGCVFGFAVAGAARRPRGHPRPVAAAAVCRLRKLVRLAEPRDR